MWTIFVYNYNNEIKVLHKVVAVVKLADCLK